MKLFDDRILEGAIDIHIHAGPDYMPRYADGFTLAQEAAEYGMRALVLKCHLSPTFGMAHAANLTVPQVLSIGSITLNGTVGGISPRSTLAALKSGARVVWLPTVDSRYGIDKAEQGHWIGHYVHSSSFGYPTALLTIAGEDGRLNEETQEVLRICKEMDAVLCSGHVSPEECIALAKEAKAIGFKNLEITHPNAWTEDFTPEVFRELTDLGAYCSLSYGACSPQNGRQAIEEIAGIIRAAGSKRLIMMTDYGQVNSPSPVQGLRTFYYQLKAQGIAVNDLNAMIKDNPAHLLNLE